MRVTPLEIRQKTFEKHFRGYDKDEVNGFLLTLSQEWERIVDESKELRIKLEATEREVTKLREVETSLYKTLKTAEDTGANVIEQARNAADLHLKESQMNATAIINEAKTKAKDTLDEAEERARLILVEMEDRLKLMVDSYKKLESSREELISELKRLANDTLDRVQRARQVSRDFDPDKYVNEARKEAASVVFPNGEKSKFSHEPVIEIVREQVVVEQETVVVEAQSKKIQKSFFDNIE
ncbi:MAG TPA: DivIVA domain-containing protein [Cyclobacteriaceae bacterium]|nr:DivIVA domain-containing protein [Cyclobacteriaceae bacterium]